MKYEDSDGLISNINSTSKWICGLCVITYNLRALINSSKTLGIKIDYLPYPCYFKITPFKNMCKTRQLQGVNIKTSFAEDIKMNQALSMSYLLRLTKVRLQGKLL